MNSKVDKDGLIWYNVCRGNEMKCDICNRDNLTEKELAIHSKYFHKGQRMKQEQPLKFATGTCPECGATMWFEEGCANCHSCGFSKCG